MKSKTRGFSLVEVVVAVGIFAIAILAVVGLLVPISSSVTDLAESDDATRIINRVETGLNSYGFMNVAAALKTDIQIAADDADVAYDPKADTKVFYATRDGAVLAPYAPVASWSANGTLTTPKERDSIKFFEITLIRNADLSKAADDASAGYLAFNILLRWPAFSGDGEAISKKQKSVIVVPVALTR